MTVEVGAAAAIAMREPLHSVVSAEVMIVETSPPPDQRYTIIRAPALVATADSLQVISKSTFPLIVTPLEIGGDSHMK
jgi:hypothetical protein